MDESLASLVTRERDDDFGRFFHNLELWYNRRFILFQQKFERELIMLSNTLLRVRLREWTFCSVITASLLASVANAETVRYQLDVNNTWSEETHPGLFPHDAHFSWLGGGTHNENATFWQVGQLASPGITQMAEDGRTLILVDEVEAEIATGNANDALSWQWWFCPDGIDNNSCGTTTVEFEIDDQFPLVTLTSMLGPSPDWFIGVSGMPLYEDGHWLPYVEVDLHPFDGGTRSANRWQLFGPRDNPPQPISTITSESGQLVGPDSLGTMTFRLLPPPLPGDANQDGLVDGSDFNLWNDHRSQTGAGWYGGDFNHDGTTDDLDLEIWDSNRFQPIEAAGQTVSGAGANQRHVGGIRRRAPASRGATVGAESDRPHVLHLQR